MQRIAKASGKIGGSVLTLLLIDPTVRAVAKEGGVRM